MAIIRHLAATSFHLKSNIKQLSFAFDKKSYWIAALGSCNDGPQSLDCWSYRPVEFVDHVPRLEPCSDAARCVRSCAHYNAIRAAEVREHPLGLLVNTDPNDSELRNLIFFRLNEAHETIRCVTLFDGGDVERDGLDTTQHLEMNILSLATL